MINNNHFRAKYDFDKRNCLFKTLMEKNSNYIPCIINLSQDIVKKYKMKREFIKMKEGVVKKENPPPIHCPN